MQNNWYDRILTLETKENNKSTGQNNQFAEREDGRPSSKRSLNDNSRSVKSVAKSDKLIGEYVDQSDGYDEDNDESSENANTPALGVKVQTSDGPEACRCFPKRSSKRVSSMLYEGLECKHTGLKGKTHPGVYKFNHNWNQELEEPDPTHIKPGKTTYGLGYSKPTKCELSDQEDARKTDNKFDKKQRNKKGSSSQQSKTAKEKFPYGILDFMLEEDEDAYPLEKGAITLPRIGYTPPPDLPVDRLSNRSVAQSLPPLPESPFVCNVHDKKTSRSVKQNTSDVNLVSGHKSENDEQPVMRHIKDRYKRVQRRFRGQYFDPVIKRTRSYEIMPNFRKGIDEWNAYIGDKGKQKSMASALNGRRTTNGNLYLHENNVVMEDDEYDDDYEDYESNDDDSDKSKQKVW